jgi:hypothetical protein
MDLAYDPPEQFRAAFDQLHDVVAAESGSNDFGPSDYVPGLKVLLQSMDYDPHFSERGRRTAWGEVIGVLKGRVHAVKSMKDNPGFDAVPITNPVVITGIPRTGTTALHRLMAADARFQSLQTWLLDSPMPRPPVASWPGYPQFQKTVAALEARHEAIPQKRAAHHRAAEEMHECCMVLRQSFVSNLWSCGWSAPTYDAWWQSQSENAAYRHYYRCVQLIGSTSPDNRWLLKNPGHIQNLDILFAIFPEAKVIQTHRDPAKAVPSLVSLLMQSHPVMEVDRSEQRSKIMLAREVAKWSNAAAKADKVRQTHPGKLLDVMHADFHSDAMGVLEQIYEFIGMDISDDVRGLFAQRITEKPELSHGVHRYNIADYGVSEEEARAPFREYIQRYDLLETPR